MGFLKWLACLFGHCPPPSYDPGEDDMVRRWATIEGRVARESRWRPKDTFRL